MILICEITQHDYYYLRDTFANNVKSTTEIDARAKREYGNLCVCACVYVC